LINQNPHGKRTITDKQCHGIVLVLIYFTTLLHRYYVLVPEAFRQQHEGFEGVRARDELALSRSHIYWFKLTDKQCHGIVLVLIYFTTLLHRYYVVLLCGAY
jgi:hypothetical protein